MVAEEPLRKLLVFNPRSGAEDGGVRRRLLAAFPGHAVLDVRPGEDLARLLRSRLTAADAEVIAAGGDGTVGAVARWLAGSRRRLGIIPTGTFNNFGRALGLPLDLEAAIGVVRTGRVQAVTIGWVDDLPFLEAAAIGLFGELVGLGEAAKELRHGEVVDRLRRAAGEGERFEFSLNGSVRRRGRAQSLVFANTPTVGPLMEVGGTSPADPCLELEVWSRGTPLRMLVRGLHGLAGRRPPGGSRRLRVGEVHVTTRPPAPVYADAFPAGETPVTVRADAGGLNVLLP